MPFICHRTNDDYRLEREARPGRPAPVRRRFLEEPPRGRATMLAGREDLGIVIEPNSAENTLQFPSGFAAAASRCSAGALTSPARSPLGRNEISGTTGLAGRPRARSGDPSRVRR